MEKSSGSFHVPKGIWAITLPQHLGAIVAVYLLIKREVSGLWLIGSYVSWVLIGVVGIGIFYHKYFAHRGFKTYTLIENVGAYLGALAGLGAPIGWVALHTDHHHRFADLNELDVHSPRFGIFNSYMGWQFRKFDLKLGSARRLLKSSGLKFVGNHYYQIYWATAVALFLIDPLAPVFLLFVPGFVHYHVEGLIASLCHTRTLGYRNYETTDNSVNIWLLGLLTWGAGFHNNHHGDPVRPHNQTKIFEIDLSRLLLFLIPKKAELSKEEA